MLLDVLRARHFPDSARPSAHSYHQTSDPSKHIRKYDGYQYATSDTGRVFAVTVARLWIL